MEDDEKREKEPDKIETGVGDAGSDEPLGGSEQGDETTPLRGKATKARVVLSLPSRQLSRWKHKAKGKNGKVMRGQIYEELSQEPGESGAEDGDDDDDGDEFDKTKPLSKRLEKHRSRRQRTSGKSLSALTALRLRLAMARKRTADGIQQFISSCELWRDSMKEIEGTFGTGVVSYFTFLRWLLFLNIYTFIVVLCFVIIPQASFEYELPLSVNVTPSFVNTTPPPSISTVKPTMSVVLPVDVSRGVGISRRDAETALDVEINSNISSEDCNLVKPNKSYTHKPIFMLVGDFMSGVGWINTTLMFYGSYSRYVLVETNGSQTFYNMPLAYFIVNCTCFIIALLAILWSASSMFEENYVREGSKHFYTYSNKVFGSWDMCVTDEKAAKIKAKIIANEIEGDLAEDFRLAVLAKRTRMEQCKTYTIRLFVNILVLGLSCLAAWLIFQATQISVKASQTKIVEKSSMTELYRVLAGYASSITLSVLNIVLPSLFFFLSKLEDWSPRTRVNMDLARTILVKLASLAVLVISLYNRINTSCMLSWENVIAAEMYKLVWMDFFVIILVIILVQTPRRYFADYVDCNCQLGQKIGRPLFIIPMNVLELVYGQSLIWIGVWYSPFLPLMAIVKLPFVFYAKKVFLMHNCRLGEKSYRAARSNYFFLLLLLGTFLMCLAAVAFGVTQIRPSVLYGPFRDLSRMYDIIPWTISVMPNLLKDSFRILGSPVFLVVVVTVICLGLYFFYAMSKAYRKMISGLREELFVETRDKKYLLKKLSGDGKHA